jgi:hypothetical protein
LAVSLEIDDYTVFLYTYAGRHYLSKIINDPKHSLETHFDLEAATFYGNKLQTLYNPFKGEPRWNLEMGQNRYPAPFSAFAIPVRTSLFH